MVLAVAVTVEEQHLVQNLAAWVAELVVVATSQIYGRPAV
jgi:hypothetical protein